MFRNSYGQNTLKKLTNALVGTSRGRYRRNLGNTVFCVLFTLIAISFLYYFIWHEALNHDEIHLSQDSIDRTYFPSVALFQRVDWTSQAVLNTTQATSKCYLGWYDNDAPHCADVPPGVLPCNCGSNWIPSVVEDFLWQNITYRYLVMVSSESLTCLSTSTEMLLQAFYWFNASQAWLDSSWHLNPSLWLSIWDPTLTLQEALEKGYTRLVLINANGMSSITLGLRSRQAIGGAPAYDYQLSVSTTPAQDLVCDVSGTIGSPSGPCHITLLLQFPTFERQISRLMPVMGWVDVISSAGSFYAVVQLLSWIVSGMVFAT